MIRVAVTALVAAPSEVCSSVGDSKAALTGFQTCALEKLFVEMVAGEESVYRVY